MPFIAISRLIATTSLAVVCCASAAKDTPPRVLQEPILGLRMNVANVKLDRLPENIQAMCEQIANDDKWKGYLWVFARANDASGATYYVVSGYFKRTHPAPAEALYDLDDRGAVYTVTGNTCSGDGPAREVFEVRDFKQTPQPVLQRLSEDLVARLVRAFGGADRLRTELRNQRIDPEQLSPELQAAFKPYFTPTR